MSKTLRWLFVERTREKLRMIEDQAVAIRKKLSEAQGNGSLDRGVINDAMQLVHTIEQLCSFGQRAAAEDAFEVAERIETLVLMLEAEIDAI